MKKKYSDFAILVLSCDKYSDLWNPFFVQFNKFWPDCPYKVYLGANTKAKSFGKIVAVNSGSEIDWSSDLISMLEQIEEQYIFIWLEDLFLIEKIDTSKFHKAFQFMKERESCHINIAPVIRPEIIINDDFGEYANGVPYRVTATGYWNVHALKELLIKGENPWNFEVMGSYRSSYQKGYYAVMKQIFIYLHVVVKGKITKSAYDYCLAHNIQINTKIRLVQEGSKTLLSILQNLLFHNMLKVDWRIRVGIVNFFRKFFVSY